MPKNYPKNIRFRVIAPAYPAYNIYSRVARKTTALGPIIIATMVNQLENCKTEVIDENNYRQFGPLDINGYPDHRILQSIRSTQIVGLYGGLSSTIPRLYELARIYRKLGVVTIAGGQHFVGDNILEALKNGIDFIVIGEGEMTISELITSIREGGNPETVAGIAFLRDGKVIRTAIRPHITDFDLFPLPDFSLLRYAKVKVYPINWIRGCGMDCEFCTVKGRPRPSSAERIVEQVASLVEACKARRFFMVDDLFGHHRGNTLRLCHLLSEYQLSIRKRLDFTVQIRLDRGKDSEMLEAMRKANINTVAIGFESPIPEDLEAMNKKVKPGDMVQLARKFNKAGFLVHGMFIFGYPLAANFRLRLTAQERVKLFKSFIRQAKLDTIQVLLPVPLPGTQLTERLNHQNRIFPKNIIGWEYYDGNFPLFQPDWPLIPEEMHLAVQKIMGRFYQFHNMFTVALNVLTFPSLVLPDFNFRAGWRRWYRSWRNALKRFGGWIIVKNWTQALKQGNFQGKLSHAMQFLQQSTKETQREKTNLG